MPGMRGFSPSPLSTRFATLPEKARQEGQRKISFFVYSLAVFSPNGRMHVGTNVPCPICLALLRTPPVGGRYGSMARSSALSRARTGEGNASFCSFWRSPPLGLALVLLVMYAVRSMYVYDLYLGGGCVASFFSYFTFLFLLFFPTLLFFSFFFLLFFFFFIPTSCPLHLFPQSCAMHVNIVPARRPCLLKHQCSRAIKHKQRQAFQRVYPSQTRHGDGPLAGCFLAVFG